jgi:hypothetical protein
MASEDSDQVSPGLAVVHRLRDLSDLDKTACREMIASGDHLHACGELLEIVVFRGPQLVFAEERNDVLHELVPPTDDELVQVLLVVVVPPIHVDPARSEELLEFTKTVGATFALRYDKPMNDLIAGFVAPPIVSVGLSDESDGEASFSVYKAKHPASSDQSFLLVVRTAQIVTAHRQSL